MMGDHQKVGMVNRVPGIDRSLTCKPLGCAHGVIEVARHRMFVNINDTNRVVIRARAALGDHDIAGPRPICCDYGSHGSRCPFIECNRVGCVSIVTLQGLTLSFRGVEPASATATLR
jgi:hypothetical protein